MALGAVAARAQKTTDGGLAALEEKVVPPREVPVLPPGAQSQRHFHQHCTACQLCVAACPNDVLRASETWSLMLQPVMAFERGYCRPECKRCSEVCPTGALRLTDLAQKAATHAGYAVWLKENCVAWRDGVACGNCARHCPVGAIAMVPVGGVMSSELGGYEVMPSGSEVLIPVVDTERCIGCGACEYLCPARPLGAIYVEGREVQVWD